MGKPCRHQARPRPHLRPSSAAEKRLLYWGHHRLSQNSLFPGGVASHEGVEVPILSDLGSLIRETL